MGELAESVDAVVIGAGPGGYVAAIRLAQLGKQVVLVEKEGKNGFGGICLHHGCIPSKALIFASELFFEAKNAKEIGINSENITVDFKKMQEWKNNSVEKLASGLEFLFKKHNINVIQGEAFFENSDKIGVRAQNGVRFFEFKKAIIATGSKPLEQSQVILDRKIVLDSKEALSLEEIPKELIVVGAGYIAIELATMFAKLGSNVTIVHRSDRMLRGFDADLVEIVKKKLEKIGVKMYFNTGIESFSTIKRGIGTAGSDVENKAAMTIKTIEGKKISLTADKVLVAIGRIPNTQGLELQNTNVKLDEKGFIKANKNLQTDDAKILAIGDVIGGALLAHKAFMEGKIAAESIAGKKSAFDNVVVPMIVFSDPEIAVAGISEEEARQKNIEIIIGKFPFSALGKAVSTNSSEGFVKIIAEKNSQQIIGIGIVGRDASNLVSEGVLAIENSLRLEDIALTIHPHPTMSEAIMESCEDALGKAIHLFKEKK